MKKFFVVGNRSSKSLSPLIFNYWFSKYKIKAKYDFIETDMKNFNKKIKETLCDESVLGMNITIPFKSKIIKYLDEIDKHAKKIKAVNYNIDTYKKKIYIYGIAQNETERDEVTKEAKQILDVEDVITSIFLVDDLRIIKK